VEIRSMRLLLVFVVAVARVWAFALVVRGLARNLEIQRLIVPVIPIHEPQASKYADISPID